MSNLDVVHFARHDPAICLTTGLFRSLSKGLRKKQMLGATHTMKNGHIRFISPELLGADDLRVLQAIIALNGPQGCFIKAVDKESHGYQLLTDMERQGDAVTQDVIAVFTEYRDLARLIGYAENAGYRTIRSSIERLSAVTIFAHEGSRRSSYQLLSWIPEKTTHNPRICLNPRLTSIIVNKRSAFVHIDLNEVRGLRSDAAVLIHQRLCGWINNGATRAVKLDTLLPSVFGDESTIPATLRQRRCTVRKAISEFSKIGWQIQASKNRWGDDIYFIRRPSLRV